MINKDQTKIYQNIAVFEGLNSLRFLAAFLVLMHHGETILKKNRIANLEWLGLFRNGGNAVTFFFVLSGFLITYLLLKENKKTGDISIRQFYLKRVLRIWPLYFLLVIIGTFLLPLAFNTLGINYQMPYTFSQTWFYFVFFLPGLVTFFFGHHFLEPLWSIGVEEVFYLIWAPVFKIGKNKILLILIALIVLKTILGMLGVFYISSPLYNYFINSFQFEAMAIGGLGAYFIYNREKPLSQLSIFKVPAQIILLLILAIYLIFHGNMDNIYWNSLFNTAVFSKLFINVLFLYLIVCISLLENSIIKLRYKTLSFLGEISYGIYMYHMLIIFSVILFLKNNLLEMNSLAGHLLFYTIVGLATIIVSTLSKFFFENYFLKLKNKLGENQNK